MDHRAVPLEVLREFARSAVEVASIRAVAEDATVGRSTLHKFVAGGTTPHPRVRRLLALWYLRRVDGVNEVEIIRPYVAALDVLLADVPESMHGRVVADVLDATERACAAAGEEPPRWVSILRRRGTHLI